MAQPFDYYPQNVAELTVFDGLWKIASVDQSGRLGGREAVDLLRKSGLEVPVLREIWAVTTPDSSIGQAQFFSALRFIAMYQNGVTQISRGIFCFSFSVLFVCIAF
jgi:hypothetical protein